MLFSFTLDTFGPYDEMGQWSQNGGQRSWQILIPCQVQLSVTMIMSAEDAAKQEEAAAMAGTWEGEKLVVSKWELVPSSDHKCVRIGVFVSSCGM